MVLYISRQELVIEYISIKKLLIFLLIAEAIINLTLLDANKSRSEKLLYFKLSTPTFAFKETKS